MKLNYWFTLTSHFLSEKRNGKPPEKFTPWGKFSDVFRRKKQCYKLMPKKAFTRQRNIYA